MGFETQEEAERWAENMEFRADQLREERLLDPKEAAWQRLVALPSHKDLTPSVLELQRAVFEYAWQEARRTA